MAVVIAIPVHTFAAPPKENQINNPPLPSPPEPAGSGATASPPAPPVNDNPPGTITTINGDCNGFDTNCDNGVVTPVPNTIGGGLYQGPVNNASPSTGDFPTPQSGSADLAQCSAIQFKSLLDILIWLKCIIVVAIIPLIFAGAFMFFLWGIMHFMMATESTRKEEGKKFILWGLIAMFVMVSVWGIVKIFSTTLGLDSSVVPVLQTEYLK